MKVEGSAGSSSTASTSAGSSNAASVGASSSGGGSSGDKAAKIPDQPPAPAPAATIPPATTSTSTTEGGLFQAPPRAPKTDNVRMNIRLECLDSKTNHSSHGSTSSAEIKPTEVKPMEARATEVKTAGKPTEKPDGAREGKTDVKSEGTEGKSISPPVASGVTASNASTSSQGSSVGGAGNVQINITRTTATYGSAGVAVDVPMRATVVVKLVNEENASSVSSPVTYATSYPPKTNANAHSPKPLMSEKDRRLSDGNSNNDDDNVSVTYATSYPKPGILPSPLPNLSIYRVSHHS